MKDEDKTKEQLINELAVLRQRIEEALRESEERHRSLVNDLLDSSTVGMFILDSNFKVIWMNRSLERYFGLRREEAIGKNKRQLIHERIKDIFEEPEDFAQKVLATYENNTYIESFEWHVLSDGEREERWLEHWSRPIQSGLYVGGRIEHYTDITNRKQAEERERQMQEELNLSSRLATIGELASGIAHEINNPLTAIVGFSQMLMGRGMPDSVKEELGIINDNAQRVAKIVRNLLTFARQHKPGEEYVDINSLISGVLELRAYEMKVRNIKVTTRLTPDLPCTMADGGQLQQVLLNIILNAEQAMVKAHNKGKLLIKTERINNSIRISFTDDGPGIASEHMDKLFDPFFTTKSMGEGTGLGLSISYGIIKEHNGKVNVKSKLGKGATFIVKLPIVAEPKQLELAETAVEEPTRIIRAKIVVIDDEPAICQFLSLALTQEGYKVETIDNASAALERLKCERYNLILLDIRMEGMDGIELYRHLKEIAPSLQRRVVFITGDTMTPSTQNFLDKTKVRCISKPFDIEQLKKEINQILIEIM